MFWVTPFKPEHLTVIKLQSAQSYMSEWVTRVQGEELAAHPSYSAILDDKPIAMAGVIKLWAGRGLAWALISDTGAIHFLKVHRAVKRFLDGCDVRRIEMTVDCDAPEAHRWAKMLGFTMEAERMRGYAPDGHDCSLYARVL